MRRLFALAAALVVPAVLTACAAPVVVTSAAAMAKAPVTVRDAWVPTTTGAKDTGTTWVYLTIVNPGEADVKLTSADCADAGLVQVHEMVMQQGELVMQETKEGIAVPAGDQADLRPGGQHIMLKKLKHRLAVGDQVVLTLHFSDGGSLVVEVPVKASAAVAAHSDTPTPTADASS